MGRRRLQAAFRFLPQRGAPSLTLGSTCRLFTRHLTLFLLLAKKKKKSSVGRVGGSTPSCGGGALPCLHPRRHRRAHNQRAAWRQVGLLLRFAFLFVGSRLMADRKLLLSPLRRRPAAPALIPDLMLSWPGKRSRDNGGGGCAARCAAWPAWLLERHGLMYGVGGVQR